MSDIKISALPGASTLTGAETIPLVQGGTTKKVTTDQFLTKDASGNVGLGVTPSAWNTTHRAIQIGGLGALSGRTGTTDLLQLSENSYRDVLGNYRYLSTAAASRYDQTGGSHTWYTAPSGTAGNAISFTQAMTLDANGNLGLGVTPSAWGTGKALETIGGSFNGYSAADLFISHNSYKSAGPWIYKNTAAASAYQMSGASHIWYTAPSGTAGNPISFTQAMALDASGNLLVGTSTTDYTIHGLKYRADLGTLLVTSTDSESFFAHRIGSTGMLVNLYCTGNAVGSISSNGTTVAYNTSSDARLKENISNADNGSALIDGLQVRQFDWKADGSHQRFGFVAQELDAVYPEAVSKPADPDEMMGVDYSKLVPLLVQEIQSLRARVAALETV